MAQKSRCLCTGIEEKYGLYLILYGCIYLHRNREVRPVSLLYGCINYSTVFEGTNNIYLAQISREYGLHLLLAQKSRQGTAALNCWYRNRDSVRSAFIRHRNRGCTAAVFAGHVFPDFEIKSWVKISCIFIVILS